MEVKVVGDVDKGKLDYTIDLAVHHVTYWREKFKGEDVESIGFEELSKNLEKFSLLPKELYNIENVWPDYIKDLRIQHLILQTSGTQGLPKQIPFIPSDDGKRVAEQSKKFYHKYLTGNTIATFFPPLPSASGYMSIEAFERTDTTARIYGLPVQLLQDVELLKSAFDRIKPTCIFGLPTTIYNLSEYLPQRIKRDVKVLLTGGEYITSSLAKKIRENFDSDLTIVDVYGTSEDGATGYRVYEGGKFTNFKFPHSAIFLKDISNDTKEIYITKLLAPNTLTGLPLVLYKIGDLARVDTNDNVVEIFGNRDTISLAGAKLHLTQIAEIIHEYENLKDFVIIYEPVSGTTKPKATIRIGYVKTAPDLDEIRLKIYEGNNPVRYEVEDSKMAELNIQAVPYEKLREGLPIKPGKPKRIYLIGKEI